MKCELLETVGPSWSIYRDADGHVFASSLTYADHPTVNHYSDGSYQIVWEDVDRVPIKVMRAVSRILTKDGIIP